MQDNEERLAKLGKRFLDDPTTFDHEAYLRYDAVSAYGAGPKVGVSEIIMSNTDITS